MRSVRGVRRPLVALVALLAALLVGYLVRGASDGGGGPPRPVALSALPVQARSTVALIRAGGPFPYPRDDGVTFHNDEHRLPAEPDGFYREYTVPKPGSPDRGPWRIVAGRDGRYWWTADHYGTFRRVEVDR